MHEMILIEEHVGGVDPSKVKGDKMLDECRCFRDTGPVERKGVPREDLVQFVGRLAELSFSSGLEPSQFLTFEPLYDCFIVISSFQPSDDLGSMAVCFHGGHDLFHYFMGFFKVLLLLRQNFCLSLQHLYVPQHLFLGRLYMELITASVLNLTADATSTGRPRAVALNGYWADQPPTFRHVGQLQHLGTASVPLLWPACSSYMR